LYWFKKTLNKSTFGKVGSKTLHRSFASLSKTLYKSHLARLVQKKYLICKVGSKQLHITFGKGYSKIYTLHLVKGWFKKTLNTPSNGKHLLYTLQITIGKGWFKKHFTHYIW
jgi:hypothetical protein